ncbi:MAG TPA: sigma-70 family RNA polymerase sigma factor [Flavobacteriales bacterium]|nr:sigma-70 family RNA polymerase sigma factor [Flavobacteriales bacterium]
MPSAAERTKEQHTTFAGWVRTHTGELARYARNRVKEPAVADDLVQLTFVSAWETMHRFAGDSSVRTWLFAILKHKLADHYRKQYREGIKVSGTERLGDDPADALFVNDGHWHADHFPSGGDDIFQDDTSEKLDRALRHCLDALPERFRTVVEMKYLMDQDSDAIRDALGLSETNYWQHVHRAKLKLRDCIQGRIAPTNR